MPNPTLILQNPGLIEMTAVTTMGVSVKEEGAIGYFGTGLKYAIATLLRLGCTITIYRGVERFDFTTAETSIRGKDFSIVQMNGSPLGFTTALGRNWTASMAYRELACNCMDEGGNIYEGAAPDFTLPESTTILCSGDPIIEAHRNRHEVFLTKRNLLYSNSSLEIHEGSTDVIYYKGVAVNQLEKKSAFTYNILDEATLTEDRTLKHPWQVNSKIIEAIACCPDETLMRKALTTGVDFYEDSLTFGDWYDNGQSLFDTVALDICYGDSKTNRANQHLFRTVSGQRFTKLSSADNIRLTGLYQSMFSKATAFLEKAGYAITSKEICIQDTLGADVHGRAHNGKIYISLLPFQKGTREVAATLLEEFLHLESGHTDCTREFQNTLFDNILVQAEKAAGEPI